jgi:hypothetical protein
LPIVTAIPDNLRKAGLFFVNQQGLSPEEARRALIEDMGTPRENADLFLKWHREQAAANEILKPPPGCDVLRYRQEIANLAWDVGEQYDIDIFWPALLPLLEQKVGTAAAKSIGDAASEVRKSCADPHHHGTSKRGLVVGYVQSGKTANYTALIAKAADAGYRGFIVLSGIHNALRRQTQLRIEHDLIDRANEAAGSKYGAPRWQLLTQTEPDRDFGHMPNGSAMLASTDLRLLAVVKKNATRLRRLKKWLADIPETTRKRCPILIIDDEADQATPNSARARDEVTAINGLMRGIFVLLPTSTYVGYTATPFANVLIDPGVAGDFYPRDFIISLPRPEGYFGAEALFGSPCDEDASDADDGYDLIRSVPDDDRDAIRPPRSADQREEFRPPVPESMKEAIRWFVLATAARRARGHQNFHSSMLIHTTQLARVHFQQADAVREFLGEVKDDPIGPELGSLERVWESERDRYVPDAPDTKLSFDEVKPHIRGVLDHLKVIVDNSLSEDRLDYTETEVVDAEEHEVPQTVIAVGGNTLSRGLTLEGLTVSYFVRSASTYDTLLQMGRWFGFRPGYGDLARVWMPDELAANFRFLAGVEAELREDIARYSSDGLTPIDAAVRIRRHPSMAVTTRMKMQRAVSAQISYAGQRRQTFLFDHQNHDALRSNIQCGHDLVRGLRTMMRPEQPSPARWVFHGASFELVRSFLQLYRFHPDHADLSGQAILDFLDRWSDAGYPIRWNVAVMGSSQTQHTLNGEPFDLGTIDLGLDVEVGMLNRSRMRKDQSATRANIKSLMSTPDRVVDIRDLGPGEAGRRDAELRALRRVKAPQEGLLALYPVSKDSQPLSAAQLEANSRVALGAVEHVLGVGLVFPDPPLGAPEDLLSSEYVQVDLTGADDYIEQDEAEWESAGEPEEGVAISGESATS